MDFLKKAAGFVVGFVVVTFAISLFSGGEELEAFEDYQSSRGRFTVSFPGEPEEGVQTLTSHDGDFDLYMYNAGSKKISFAVAYVDYPDSVFKKRSVKEMLDGAVDGAVNNVGGKLIDEIEVEYEGYPGREIEVSIASEKAIIRARIYLVDKRLYQLMVIGKEDQVTESRVYDFFDSFVIE
ncbi:MAG: hypothetical protein JW912_07835 [Sedimentisphaerales bacterium]|nr:hypothetical protein [Sedimentisphaerales bacterium]